MQNKDSTSKKKLNRECGVFFWSYKEKILENSLKYVYIT